MKHLILLLLLGVAGRVCAQQNSRTLLFETDKWALSNSHKVILDSIIADLHQIGDYRVSIFGHTDDKGSSPYNMRLSERRSTSVADYFRSQLEKKELSINFLGEDKPVRDNSSAQSRKLNRRVEIVWNLAAQLANSEEGPLEKGPIKDLAEFYKLIAPPAQQFCIDNDRDTVLKGEEGTLIFIKAHTFEVPSAYKSCVSVSLKECYKKSNIIRENLSTLTKDGELLVSQAMFKIDSDMPLSPDGELVTFNPTEEYVPEIASFIGERGETGVMHWQSSNDPISSISGTTFNNFLGSVCRNDTIVFDTLDTKCRLFFCKILDWTRIKRFQPKIEQRTILDTIRCPLPPNLRGYIPDTTSLEIFKKMPSDSLKYYVFKTSRLGWGNLDWLSKIRDKTDYKVYLKPEKEIDIKLIFTRYRSTVTMLPKYPFYHYYAAPVGYGAWILAFKIENGHAFLGLKEVKLRREGYKDFSFEQVSIDELYERLKIFD